MIFQSIREYVASAIAIALTTLATPGFKLFAADPRLVPVYNKLGDSGFDLRANLATDIYIEPGERQLVMTGLHIEMPVGFELQIRPRSGWALKEGVTVVNAPGTIDANYRGEIGVIILNTDKRNRLHIKPYDRIAQGVVQRVERINWEVVPALDDLAPTDRGATGFGDSGKQ